MKFELALTLLVDDDQPVGVDALIENPDAHKDDLSSMRSLEGRLVCSINGSEVSDDYSDPILRLAHLWLSKVAWVIGGDTETVALRDSERCFAFVAAGESVEVSFFNGTEEEIEDYIFEPTHVRLEDFAKQSIRVADELARLINAVDASLWESDEDCKDLKTSTEEAKKAWHNYEIHRGR
ncbi:MAG: hypothetical protein AAFX94_22500 [Myxococcota bacterium]